MKHRNNALVDFDVRGILFGGVYFYSRFAAVKIESRWGKILEFARREVYDKVGQSASMIPEGSTTSNKKSGFVISRNNIAAEPAV